MDGVTVLLIVASFFIGIVLQRIRQYYANLAGMYIEEDDDD